MKSSRRFVASSLVLASHLVLATASTTTGSGILPPPPPPPPRDAAAVVKPSISEEKSVASDDKPSDVSGTDSTAPFAEVIPKETESSTLPQIDPLGIRRKDDSDESSERTRTEHEDASSESQPPQKQSTWDSFANSESNTATQTTEYQHTQPYGSQQSWAYQQPQSEYRNQYSQGQWAQSYDGQYGSQQQQQQHHYQQPYPQQRQPYLHPSQSQQLVRYNRPQQPNAKQSASRLFNMAVRKIQTGIDTVSESIDTNKVASSVSSLTSRLGELGDVVSSSVGLSGRGAGRPRPMQGMGQRYPQQRMDPRRAVQHKQEYAPPMSELYSLESSSNQPDGRQAGVGNVGVRGENQWSGEGEGDVHAYDGSMHYPGHNDASDTDGEPEVDSVEGGAPDVFGKSTQSTPKFDEPQNTLPSELRRPQSINPRPQPRESDRKQSTQSWPNGGSTSTSSATRPRQYSDYDDYESSSIGSKVKSVIGSVPIPSIPRMFKRGSEEYDDGAWSDDESKEKSRTSSSYSTGSSRRASTRANAAIVPRPVISLLGKRNNLLSAASAKRCVSVGRTQAILNAAQLALVVLAMHELLPVFYNSLSKDGGDLRATILSAVLSATDGWAWHALCAAFLISASNAAWIEPALRALSKEAAGESETEAAYTQLYLRLISSIPMKKSFPSGIIRKAAQVEAFNTASTARLHFFVTLAVGYILLSTVAVLKPAGAAVASAAMHLIQMDAFKQRPIEWNAVLDRAKTVGFGLAGSLKDLFYTELEEIQQQPLRVVVVLSLLTALLVASHLPSLERNRKGNLTGGLNDEDEEEDTITSLWSNIGSSSATRLSLLSSPRGVEGALDQFSKLRPDRAAAAGVLPSRANTNLKKKRRMRQAPPSVMRSLKPLLQELGYLVTSSCILMAPLALYTYVWANTQSGGDENMLSFKSISMDGWSSLLEMAALLFATNIQVGKAAHNAIIASNARLGSSLTAFFQTLAGVVGEVQKLAAASSNSDFQAMLTASPTAGIVVNDFWAAHSTRKAWAVKGANLKCRNGEVVLVIGAGGAGKSRLLTSISEHIFAPPKSARTTTHARGTINVAGVDLAKWDRAQLQRRVGVWLHDVRTVSDYASLVTGCTLEEILEPVSDSQMSTKERNAVALAMKVTGLGSKLSKQLPSRLSTVVSANEDELKPSPLRPPSYPLSPSDWSLVLLTKVLAQLIAGNDNQQSTPNSIAKCLIGSILLLDDATAQMSEVDEAKFITALRNTGAAVLLTSNRWASGRFADRIVVVDNGSVVESGTHADLINMGPERSLYAHHWNAMASI